MIRVFLVLLTSVVVFSCADSNKVSFEKQSASESEALTGTNGSTSIYWSGEEDRYSASSIIVNE